MKVDVEPPLSQEVNPLEHWVLVSKANLLMLISKLHRHNTSPALMSYTRQHYEQETRLISGLLQF
jgi:hypothetical protein